MRTSRRRAFGPRARSVVAAAAALAFTGLPRHASATVFNYDGISPYTQNFDLLPSPTGTTSATGANTARAGWRDDTAPPGSAGTITQTMGFESWYYTNAIVVTSGSNANDNGDQRMRVTDGSTTTGALYDFGTAASTDRALGFLDSNVLNSTTGGTDQEGQPSQFLALRIRNNSGQTLTQFTLNYTGEQWHKENTTVQQAAFSYAVLDPALTPALAPRTSGSVTGTSLYYTYLMDNTPYTVVPSLNFVSPIHDTTTSTALDGNNFQNKLFGINATVTGLSWAPGTDIWLRWVDINDVNRDQGLAIDDLTFSASAAPASAAAANWNVDSDGSWSDSAKWLNGVRNAVGAKAQLYSVISAPRTVTLDQNVTLGNLTIGNNYSYKIDGNGHTLTIDGGAGQHGILSVVTGPNTGVHEITAPVVFATPADVSVGILGHLKFSNTVTGKISSLSLIFGGVDLGSNNLTIDYTGASPIDDIRNDLSVGRGTGAWSTTGFFGITSSVANADAVAHPTSATVAYGYAEAAGTGLTTFDGNFLDATTLLIKLTVYGDANLNGHIDPDDLAMIDRGYARYQAGTLAPNTAHWTDGDFNYDKIVDVNDYALIDRVLGQQGPFAPGFLEARDAQFGDAYVASLLAAIPEPSLLVPLAACLPVLQSLTRRRRRH